MHVVFRTNPFPTPIQIVRFSAALPWSNFDVLDAKLAAASTPGTPAYGQWMTGAEVNALTAPAAAVRVAAAEVLATAGATCVDYPHSLKCTASVSAVESLFSTKISAYSHKARADARVLRVDPTTAYTFPEAARTAGIKFFTNLVDFPTAGRKLGAVASQGSLYGGSAARGFAVMPETLDSFYGTARGSMKSSQAPAEFNKDAYYSPTDLAAFAQSAGRDLWNITNTVGPFSPDTPDVEATLDEQYLGAIGTGNDNW